MNKFITKYEKYKIRKYEKHNECYLFTSLHSKFT